MTGRSNPGGRSSSGGSGYSPEANSGYGASSNPGDQSVDALRAARASERFTPGQIAQAEAAHLAGHQVDYDGSNISWQEGSTGVGINGNYYRPGRVGRGQ